MSSLVHKETFYAVLPLIAHFFSSPVLLVRHSVGELKGSSPRGEHPALATRGPRLDLLWFGACVGL